MSGLDEKAASVVKRALAANVTIVTAESCTAGALSTRIAQAPDAGKVFHGGFVVYTKKHKSIALGVAGDLLDVKTAVAPEIAEAMAIGALRQSPADIAVSITGVAGPEPDEDGNEVGLVFVSVIARDTRPVTQKLVLGKASFDEIRDRSIAEALTLLEMSITARNLS